MIDAILSLVDSCVHFFEWCKAFFDVGFYDRLVIIFSGLVKHLTLASIEFMIFIVPFVFDVAKQILTDLNINSMIQSAWAGLDSSILSYATLLRIPDCVNILLSGAVARYVMRFIPFA